MMIPCAYWHHYVGHPVLVHTARGTYRGSLGVVTGTHVLLHHCTMVSANTTERTAAIHLLEKRDSLVLSPELVYYPAAALAIPLTAIVGITAISLGALGAW